MPITLPGGFNVTSVEPVDARFSLANQAARLGLSTANVYEGLIVFQRDNNTLYVLLDETQPSVNASWQVLGAAISGSLVVTGSVTALSGFTGSLFGTSSWAINALTSSFTPNALVTASVNLNTITFTKGDGTTFPITVNTGSGGGGGTGAGFPFSGSAVITGSLIITGSMTATQGVTGSLFGTASWAQNATTAAFAISILDQGFVHTQSTPSTSWTITHNLNSQVPHVDVYGSDYYQVIPQEVFATSVNTVIVTFPTALSGFAIVSKGSGTAVSASFATSASFASNTPFYKVGVSGSSTYTVSHNLNEDYPIVQIYDAVDREQIIPVSIQSINANQVFINIGFSFSGSVVVKK